MYGSNIGFIGSVKGGATWDEVTDYLSPAVLDIVSPRELSKELMQLSGNFLRKGRWRARRSKLADGLGGHFDGLELHDNLGAMPLS